MKLALSLCLSFLLAAPQISNANTLLGASVGGALGAVGAMGEVECCDAEPPRLYEKIVAQGFVATDQAQCEAHQSAIQVSPALCTKALKIARKEHSASAPVYRSMEDCAYEHPRVSCIARAAISKRRHDVRVFQPAFSGALIFKTRDNKLGVNAVMAGHDPDAWTRAGFIGVARIHTDNDSLLPGWLVVDYGPFPSSPAPDIESRMINGERANMARSAGCPGYGYAMTREGYCPVSFWLSPAR